MPEAKPILIKKDAPEFDKVNDSTYKLSYNKNAEVEIGNISEEGFHPHAKIKRWKDGSSFSLELSKSKVTSLKEEEGKIKCKIGTKKEIHYYPLDKTHMMEEGGFEVEVVLKSKPTTNVIEFDIDNENFAFYKQLPYNKQTESPEDKAAGVVKRTETQGLDKDDNVIVEMSENVVNSYAVYHKTKFDSVYRTGKAFHIYRPKAVDKNSKETWCDLDIDTVTNKLTVTVPQTFINTAAYPVKVDPTFGYTTLGSYYIYLSNCIIGRNAEPDDEHGIVNSMHVGLDTSWDSGDKVKMALYNLKGSLISPQTVERDQGHDTCQFVHFPIDATPAKCPIRKICYIIAWWSDQSVPIRRDYGSYGSSRYSDTTYGTWPENVNWSLSSYIYSTYSQYEFENYNDWTYTKEVVIDTTNAGAEVYNDVSDIPVLLRLDDTNFDFSQAKSDGTDLRFSKSDGTKLYYARERWDSVSEKAEIWVYPETVNGFSTTTIKMYWGKSDAPDTSMPKSVFDTCDDFEGAWHLDEDSGNTAHDETYNENDGTYNGDLPDQKDGVIYKSQDFDGGGDYISLPDNCNVISQWTLMFWIKPKNPDDYERIFIQGAGACASMQIVAYWLNGRIEFGWTNTGTCTPDIASGAIPNGLWTHVVWTFNGTTHKVYINGVSSSISPTGSNIFVDGDVYIGCRGGTQNFWTGELDELWLISNDRSAGYVKLVYETQRADQSATIRFKAPMQACLWAEVDPGVTDDIYREDGNVGIGAFTPNDPPDAKLEVRGDVRLGYDNAVSNPSPSIIMVLPPVMSGPTMAEQNRQNIQNAIEQAALNGGGTVILQKGIYALDATPGENYSIMIREGVQLIGAGVRATILDATDLESHVIVSDPAWYDENEGRWRGIRYNIVMKNFIIEGNTDNRDFTGIYMQGVEQALLENVRVDGCKTGIHLKGWVNTIVGCWVQDCYVGYDLSWDYDLGGFRADATNATSLHGCHYEGESTTPPATDIVNGSYDDNTNRVTINTGANNHHLQNGGEATISGCGNTSYNKDYTDVIVVSDTEFTAIPIIVQIPPDPPSGVASDGVVTGRIIGAYVSGYLNSFLGCTIERRGDNTEELNETIGILLRGGHRPNIINGCYFEGWKTNFILDACMGVNIIGNYYYRFGDNEETIYRNNADQSSHGNSFLGNHINVRIWDDPKTLTTVSSWANNELVLNTTTAHEFRVGDDVVVAGCLPAAFNGTYEVIEIISNTSFRVEDTTDPGTMTQAGTANALRWKHTGRNLGAQLYSVNNNLGIGESNPSEQLHVVGNVRMVDGNEAAGNVLTSDANGVGSWQPQSAVGGWTDDGTVVRLTTDTDQVGVGTDSPNSKLHVVGNIRMVDGNEAAGNVLTSDVNGEGSWQPNSAVGGWTDDGTVVRLTTPSDKVGIGTSSPNSKLEVNGRIAPTSVPTRSGPVIDASDANVIFVSGATAVTALSNGVIGQVVILIGATGTRNITETSGGHIRLSPPDTHSLQEHMSITLLYDGNDWIETSYAQAT